MQGLLYYIDTRTHHHERYFSTSQVQYHNQEQSSSGAPRTRKTKYTKVGENAEPLQIQK